jgi:TRAP transporter TAXI family solute receptor
LHYRGVDSLRHRLARRTGATRRSLDAGGRTWPALLALVVFANLALMYVVVVQRRPSPGQKVHVPVFTASRGGTFVQLADVLAKATAADDATRIKVVPLGSDGSVENLDHVAELENALSFTFVRIPDYLRRREQYDDLRAVAVMDFDVAHVVVATASGIKSVSDLATARDGAPPYRVYVGLPRSGTRETAREILTAAFDAQHDTMIAAWEQATGKTDFEQASRQLLEGRLDAGVFAAGMGATAIRRLFTETAPGRFQWLSLDDNVRSRLVRLGYQDVTVTSYDRRTAVRTVGDAVLVVSHKNTEAWIVREFADLLGRHRADFEPILTRSVSGPASLPGLVTDPSELKKMRLPMPLHAGLTRSNWERLRNWRYQLPLLAALMAAQVALLLRMRRPMVRPSAAGGADPVESTTASRLSDPVVISAAIAAAASIVVALLKP